MNDPLGRPVSLKDLQNNDQDGTKRLESKLYLIRVSDDDVADLSDCYLTTLPSEFYNLCRIFRKEIVNVSNNHLKSLKIRGSETDLVKLNGILKQLNASCNLLKEVPCGLLSVHSLVKLDLSKNQIGHIPSQITELCKLEELNFSENSISELPSSVSNLVHLRVLDVSLNKIRCLPTTLFALEELKVLKIDEDRMEYPPSDVCVHGLHEIQQYLKDCSLGSRKLYAEKSISANGMYNNKVTDINGGTFVSDKRFLGQSCGGKVEIKKEELSNERLKKLVQEQRELDDLVQNAFDKRSKDLKSILEDISELEKRTSALIESSVMSCRTAKDEDIDFLRVEDVLRQRRIELDKEQKEWLKSVNDEADQLAKLVYFEADQRRRSSMKKIALKVKEADLLANLRTEEGQNSFARICKEIAADQTLLEDFVLAMKERSDLNSRNLSVEAETIAKALADISQLEMRRRNEENNAVLEKLKEEREKMLMVYEQISAEKDFRRKQLYVDMQNEMEKEEESQKRIVAECLRRYAELVSPVPFSNSYNNNNNNLGSSPPQKSKLSKRLIPFSLLFSWKKKTEKAGRKALRGKLKDTINASESKRIGRGLPATIEGANGNASSLMVARYEEECVVCLNAKVRVLIFPCGHVCCCEKCATELKNCPLCRTAIQRLILLSSSAW